MPPKVAQQPFSQRLATLWQTRKRDLFFGFMTMVALSQVVRRELVQNKIVSPAAAGYDQQSDPTRLQATRVRKSKDVEREA